ncbi:TPM domain-containing protein [Microcella daejeonensis]|uniref:TPM domain-containing protein n=1 Tax=Microcella daejeonensis TaxID=2994971 RepID=A0A9E8MKV4_9MICO|nr:TPM domain-containing protein [Microcella daejeonensis]WAB80927.1 TPM domain-containing protein [Microcella daejeonensis]
MAGTAREPDRTAPSLTPPRSRARGTGRAPRRLLAAAAALALVVGGAPSPALASEPVDLGGAYVLDETGVLDGRIEMIEAELDALIEAEGASLFVVVTDRFDGTATPADWADRSAVVSGLGDRDALLAIAVDDRAYAYSVGAEWPVDDATLARAETEALLPALRADDYAGGVIAFSEALRGQSTGAGGAPLLAIVVLGAVVIAVVIWLVLRRRRRTGAGGGGAPDRETPAQTEARASRRLVELDDALTTSEQELGFAEAQFGAEAVAPFRDAVREARARVAEAFRLHGGTAAPEGETGEQRQARLQRAAALCDEADALLEQQEEAFDALRDVEAGLPEALPALRAAHPALQDRAQAAAQQLEALRTRFAPAALTAVADADAQQQGLLSLIEAELAEAEQSVAAGATGAAAVDVRAAQLAQSQLTASLDGLERLAAELDAAAVALPAHRVELEQGIAAARGLPASEALAAAIATAEAARAATDQGAADPLAAAHRLVEADRALDAAIDSARAEVDRRAAAVAALDRSLAAARSRILSAAEFIAAHRGAVGATARAALAEAQALLDTAVAAQQADPLAAVAASQQAVQRAAQALEAAQADVASRLDGAEQGGLLGGAGGGGGLGGLGGLGGMLGGAMGGSRGGSGIGDAIIGGIIGGLLSGGGGSRGSGGSGFGGPSFGSSRRSGGGGFGGGGFGGGARRASSGGGRSSGRRSGGGRF